MSIFDDDSPNGKRLLHIAIEIHEDNTLSLPPEVLDRLVADPTYLQGVLISLLIMQGSDPTMPECDVDTPMPCGASCPCYNTTIASSALEFVLDGNKKDAALQFLFEEFITQFEKPTILH